MTNAGDGEGRRYYSSSYNADGTGTLRHRKMKIHHPPARTYSDNSRPQTGDPLRIRTARSYSDNGRLESHYPLEERSDTRKIVEQRGSRPKKIVDQESQLDASHYQREEGIETRKIVEKRGSRPKKIVDQDQREEGIETWKIVEQQGSRPKKIIDPDSQLDEADDVFSLSLVKQDEMIPPYHAIDIDESSCRVPVQESWLRSLLTELLSPEMLAMNFTEAGCLHLELAWNQLLLSWSLFGSVALAVIWAVGFAIQYIRSGHHGITISGWAEIGAVGLNVLWGLLVNGIPILASSKILLKILGFGFIRVTKKWVVRVWGQRTTMPLN